MAKTRANTIEGRVDNTMSAKTQAQKLYPNHPGPGDVDPTVIRYVRKVDVNSPKDENLPGPSDERARDGKVKAKTPPYNAGDHGRRTAPGTNNSLDKLYPSARGKKWPTPAS